MTDEHSSAPRHLSSHHMTEHMIRHFWIQSAERIVEKVYVSATIEDPSERHTLPLTSREVYAALADLSSIAVRKQCKVVRQTTRATARYLSWSNGRPSVMFPWMESLIIHGV